MPKAKWKDNKGFKPALILEKLYSIAQIDANGRVSYDALDHHQWSTILQSMIKFPRSLVWPIRKSAISNALSAAVKSGDPSEAGFMDALNDALASALSTRERVYNLLTTVSSSGARVLKTCNIDDCQIRFINGPYPKKYGSRAVIEKQYCHLGTPTPANYQKLIISTKARHPHEAVHKSLQSLDICRAMLCLFTNYQMQLSWGASTMPINRIVLGSMHSLHLQNGALDNQHQYWYEPYPDNPKPYSYTSAKAKTIAKNITWMLRALHESKYGDQIKVSLLRYVRALDERDPNTSMIKMWGALEALTLLPGENYDAIVRRCSFVVADSKLHRQNLEALRDIRNGSVHAGEYSEEAKTYCYLMQFYFYCLFIFHVGNCRYFKSLPEANEFLDLPIDKVALDRKKELLNKAIEFRS